MAFTDNLLILFDGVCNLCQRSVQLVIRNDRSAQFRFASLQSQAAMQILGQQNYQFDKLDSVLLLENGILYRKSQAALRIARRMDGAWPMVFYLFNWIPALIADPVYDFIGNRRYKWFGRKDRCWVPGENLRGRFLDCGQLTSAKVDPPSN